MNADQELKQANRKNASPMKSVFSKIILIASLGYLVDIYDLVLFAVVRMASLKELGFSGPHLLSKSIWLINAQTSGLLVGGLVWGILCDKIGRAKTLFASILLFSVCTFINTFVHSIELYVILRFLTGVGLAGELGIGMTLMVETVNKASRGRGTIMIFSLGMLGAVIASQVSVFCGWRMAFMAGGLLGLILLFFRSQVSESPVFLSTLPTADQKKSIWPLFKSKAFLLKYIQCTLIGVSAQYIPGILIVFSPEVLASKALDQPISIGTGILFNYLGVGLGSILSGIVSQRIKSRKSTISGFLVFTLCMVLAFLLLPYHSIFVFYGLCGFMGIGSGFWSIAVLLCAEQFGTNVRGMTTTSITNFARAGLLVMVSTFGILNAAIGAIPAALSIGLVVLVLAILSSLGLKDTFDRDIDYLEV